MTQAQLEAALKPTNQRSQAAINGYKNLNNRLGKYVNEPGELIGASSGPIVQDRGVGGGLPASVLAAGVPTPGTPGTPGTSGPQGPAGLSALETVSTSVAPLNTMKATARTATCPAGKVAISGGVQQTNSIGAPSANVSPTNLSVATNARTSATSWSATVQNSSALQWHFVVSVHCAIVDP